jgi:threonine dehydrogenase-like Zn-dependent dehydrogenase
MTMRGTVLYGARDVRYEEVPEPKILKPTDAIIRLAATCVAVRTSGLIAVSMK